MIKNSSQGGTVKERCRRCDCITDILGEWAFEGNAEFTVGVDGLCTVTGIAYCDVCVKKQIGWYHDIFVPSVLVKDTWAYFIIKEI